MAEDKTYWIISVPVGESTQQVELGKLREEVSSLGLADVHHFQIPLPPDIPIGTLDNLMRLNDDIAKIDMNLESVFKKIERQYVENTESDQPLVVDRVSPQEYLQRFAWDEARYPIRRPLKDILGRIQVNIIKMEKEMKYLNSALAEKKTALAALERKRGGNLMVTDLDAILTPEVLPREKFIQTDFLSTQIVVMSRTVEQQWLESYESLDAKAVPVRNGDAVDHVSPVVPRSAVRILEDKDGFVLYTVVVLEKYLDSFRDAARENRFTVREFVPNEDVEALSPDDELAALQVEAQRLTTNMCRWAAAHYGEAMVAWCHMKALRIFMESVLRFGLPVNFVAALISPVKGKEKKLRDALARKYGHLAKADMLADLDVEMTAGGLDVGEFYPYVYQSIAP